MLRKLALAVPFVVLACACQAIFGDFTVEPVPVTEPVVLGTACEPEVYRCTGAVLERCADDRKGFVAVETCQSAAECNLNAKACRPCMAGEFMCRGKTLELCDNGAWQKQPDCLPEQLCRVTDVFSGSCVDAECPIAGAHACQGPTLVRCAATQDRWEPVELCGNGELCDADHADELVASGLPARCQAAECAKGAFRCEAGTLQVCAPDRTSWLDEGPCESAELCSATRGTCGPCEPGEVECNGAVLRSCGATGVWETLDTCESAALCDAEEGQCQPAECQEPGALRCGNRPVLERCSDDLLWEDFEACANEVLCSASAGRCLSPACAVDETRCRGGQFERCSGDRTHFTVVTTCAAGESCDATEGCSPGSCMEGPARCNGSTLERCVGGRVEIVQQCATESLCNAMGCAPPVCGPGPEYECDGRITRRCPPGRNSFEEFFTCEAPTMCNAPAGAGRYECDVCTPDDYDCAPDTLTLLRCSPDGQTWERVQSCPAGCTVAGDGIPTCN